MKYNLIQLASIATVFMLLTTVTGCSSNSKLMNSIGSPFKTDYVSANSYNSNDYNVVSSFTTSYEGGTLSRITNIKLAAEKINGTIINSKEEFSYNNTVGPTTKNNGFALGRIFINGQDAKGYGGGVCQVSSTLYNTAKRGNFEITERHPHSKKVNYVPDDMDAATSYGGIDFKFINNRDVPVKIMAYATDTHVTVSLVTT